MSVSALTQVFYHSKSTNADRLIMLAIANFETDQGAWPALATIERVTGGLNRRTIQRSIDKLVQMGELIEHRREGRTNVYSVAIRCPDDCDGTTRHETKGGGVETTPAQIVPKNVEIIQGGRSGDHGGGGVQTTLTKDNERKNEIERKPASDFADFWEVYPRKLDKGKAERAFKTALKKATADQIIAGAIRYRDDPNRKPDFTKYPATWLNAEAWENETATAGIEKWLSE